MIRQIIVVASIIIGGCTTLDSVDRSYDESVYQNHVRQLDFIDNWEIKGRISIRSGDEGGIGRLYWKRNGTDHRFEMYGNFGTQRIRIFQDSQSATLENSEGKKLFGRSAEDVLEVQTGLNLPMDELITWIVGKSYEGLPSAKSWNSQGQLISIQQSGWAIRYSKYKNFSSFTLPTRIRIVSMTESREIGERDITSSQTVIKLAISSWGLE